MYRVADSSGLDESTHALKGVHVTSGPDANLDFDNAIAQVMIVISVVIWAGLWKIIYVIRTSRDMILFIHDRFK